MPEGLTRWLQVLAGLPAGSSFASVCETLRSEHSELVGALEAAAIADRNELAEMSFDEAREEFEGALGQLRARQIRARMDGLIAQGLDTPQAREEYQRLVALRSRG